MYHKLNKDDRAASEVIGSLLLIGLVVTTTVLAGSGVFLSIGQTIEQSDKSLVDIRPIINETTVSVQHLGGEEFDTNTVQIMLIGDSGRKGPYMLNEGNVNGSGLSDGTFEMSDIAAVSHNFTGLIDIYLFSTETNERLYYTIRSPLPESSPSDTTESPPNAVASALQNVSEGFSISLDGSGSTDSDGSIVSYSWTITDGSGSITEDNTATPNATYVAPEDVTETQTVTIELTTTDDDGNTDTTTLTVNVIDTDTETIGLSGDGTAFNDLNNNGVFDDDESVYTNEELYNFSDETVDLVITSSAEDLENNGNDIINIKANTITADNDFTAKGNGEINLEANGTIDIRNSNIESTGSQGGVTITSLNGEIRANNTVITVQKNAAIALSSKGDIYLESATLDGGDVTANLGVLTAKLYVEGLNLPNSDLIYNPDVEEIPERNDVSPT